MEMPDTQPGAPRCPRHARERQWAGVPVRSHVGFGAVCREPFRLFFPAATLVGILGVLLWPLMLSGWMTDYPGTRHARLMIHGFFGGFVFGFMGTSFPRFTGTAPLVAWETMTWLVLFIAGAAAHALGFIHTGDGLFLAQIVFGTWVLGRRLPSRNDLPPPGFVLVGTGVACGVVGTMLALANAHGEAPPSREVLARLLAYHAFILLSVLGAGGFLLPRFLGLGIRRKLPSARTVTPEWRRSACVAGATGAVIVSTYILEAFGWSRSASTLRAGVMAAYLWREMPLEKLRMSWRGVDGFLTCGLLCLPLGMLAAGWFSGWRVALSHIELVTGFGLITLGVGTRVIFGHSGTRAQLEKVHPTLVTVALLILVAMLSRVTGDLVPSTMETHYLYASICWLGGLLLWAVAVLPKVLKPDPEG